MTSGVLWRPRALATLLCIGLVASVGGCGGDDPADEGQPARTSPAEPGPPGTASPGPPELSEDAHVIATGLDVPWDIAFLPDGAALVTERSGRILQLGPETDTDGLPRVQEWRDVPGVAPAGEGGLLGIAVSPEFASDETVFVYYTTGDDNRIARLTAGGAPEPILTGIPAGRIHNGGQLAFGPDGYLYASTGDAGDSPRAQDRDSLAGKILRMTVEGEPAPDNPFDNYTWAYGLRNVQGLAWDAGERLWATEFGANEWDEVNHIEAGSNYGWPAVEGPGDQDQYVDPSYAWEPAEASCSGAAVIGVTLVVACLRGQRLWRMELTDEGTVIGAPDPLLTDEYGRLRAATVAPDGSLWVSTSNRDGRARGGPAGADDRIIRLGASGGSPSGPS